MNDHFSKMTLSKKDFNSLGKFIHGKVGIKMPDVKRGMIESRLRKRLTNLALDSFSDYCSFLFSPEGMDRELPHFIDAITTNKTDFFREPHHFSYMLEVALPDLVRRYQSGVGRKFTVWSSACSRGDEPYTLAMVLSEYARHIQGFDYSILATDISTRVLNTAVSGIYDKQIVDPVPMEYRKRYLLRSRDKSKNLVRIRPELRKKVVFRQLNLMDDDYGIRHNFDMIFCRNVIIYFDKPTTDRLMVKLCNKLVPGGYLFMGHSELLDCSHLPVVSVAPTIYKRTR